MKLLTALFPPVLCYLEHLKRKYVSEHSTYRFAMPNTSETLAHYTAVTITNRVYYLGFYLHHSCLFLRLFSIFVLSISPFS